MEEIKLVELTFFMHEKILSLTNFAYLQKLFFWKKKKRKKLNQLPFRRIFKYF